MAATYLVVESRNRFSSRLTISDLCSQCECTRVITILTNQIKLTVPRLIVIVFSNWGMGGGGRANVIAGMIINII